MLLTVIRRSMAITAIVFLGLASSAAQGFDEPAKKSAKPYRIYTSGKQVTVKSSRSMKHIMVWTSGGHRIVEQRNINLSEYSFTVNHRDKYVFLMVQFEGSKPYTEKIGI